VSAALAAGLPPSVELPTVVLELLLPREPAGGAPIAVVPVDGDAFVVLPGVVGPANVLELVEPRLFVPAMVPAVGPAVTLDDEPTLLLPSVLEPSVCGLVLLPQGAASGTPVLVWAIAPTVQAASTAMANLFIASLLEVRSLFGGARAPRVQ
jgi:hypothetical protein